MAIVKIRNVNTVEKFIIELPKNIDKQLSRNNTKFMERVLYSAKRNAPVDTGSLKDSIKLMPIRKGKNVKKWQIVVNSPYGLFQEEGFTPHSFFAGGAFNSSKLSPGTTYFVSKYTPFMKPALDSQIKSLSNGLNVAMERAIKAWN